MAVIAPFRGLTYNFKKMGDMSRLVAPPYDVISPKEQEEFYRAHPKNVVRLILGKKKKGDSDWDNRYTRSADYLKRWESEDILIRSEYPSIYLVSHTYDPGDGSGLRVRWGFIALVRIEEEGSAVILPHERTFSAHKDDRLRLMRACNAQLSQVFALYDDSDNIIFHGLKQFTQSPPQVSFTMRDGTGHKMWIIQDNVLIRAVQNAMRDKSIFIADGHHRYETSRNYRNIMRARYGDGRGTRSYEYLMMYLSDMNDRGLTILPSHRLIKKCGGFIHGDFIKKAGQWFEVDALPFTTPCQQDNRCADFQKALARKGDQTPAIGFHYHGGERYYLLSLRQGITDTMDDGLHPSLKKLDVIVLSRLLLQEALGFTDDDLDNDSIFHYNSNMAESIRLVDSGEYEMAFLLNPTRMDQVKEVAGNSLIMPRKSTYFYPKVLTGLVFNKIDPHETVQIA